MIAPVTKHQRKEPPGHGRVLTSDEAFPLLDANHNYMKSSYSHVGEKHQAEILADAMMREGLNNPAMDLIHIHDAMMKFSKGDFKAGLVFTDGVLDSLVESTSDSKFAGAAQSIARALKAFGKLAGDDIDWQRSTPILAQVKREQFPKDVTMIEKLNDWQSQQGERSP